MTKKEILELSPAERLEEILDHQFAIKANICKEHLQPIIYEGGFCPLCSAIEDIDIKDKELGNTINERDKWEEHFNDMEQERDELQIEFENLETVIDEIKAQLDYAKAHCPEIDI